MALGWSARRQLLYYAVGAIIFGVLGVVVWYTFFTETPICFDGQQNADERGVDCGGSCTLICAADAKAPTLLWSRSFNTAGNLYTAAAYVQNNNTGAGAKKVSYSFQLYDANNLLVVERKGVADLPPIPTVPLIEHNINVGNRVVTRTQFSFSSVAVWNKIQLDKLPVLRKVQQPLANNGTKLEVEVFNDSLVDARNVVVAAVLFDAGGVARAAGKTLIDRLSRKSSQNVVFTWPKPNPNIVRVEVTLLPSF